MIRFIKGFIRYVLYREFYWLLRKLFGPVGLIAMSLARQIATSGGFDRLTAVLHHLL